VGIDISPTALQLASAFGKKSNESYILGDFLSGTAVKNQKFDWFFEHTCFCAIPPTRRSDYVSAAASALRPGGHLLAVFFKNPENPDYQSPPFPCEVEELNQLFSPHFEMIESIENIPTYSGREGREILRLLRKF
jgi:SAM-dependent methyltransferase